MDIEKVGTFAVGAAIGYYVICHYLKSKQVA